MRKLFLTLSLGLAFYYSNAQKEPDPVLYDRYSKENYSAYDYIKAAYTVKWKPQTNGIFNGSFSSFEENFPKYVNSDSRVLPQMKMDGCYYCALELDYFRMKYNSKYNPVTPDLWGKMCPLLYILMTMDSK